MVDLRTTALRRVSGNGVSGTAAQNITRASQPGKGGVMATHAENEWTRTGTASWPGPAPPLAAGQPLRLREYASPEGGLRASGSVDVRSHRDWERALQAVTTWRREVYSLDLTELDFIDVRGVGALVDAASLINSDQQLVVEHPPPCLLRTMQLLWPKCTPAITFT
ncbi:STAS domain-containing protein [Glycomyces tarimensis]